MSRHPFGDLLSQFRARKHGLTQTRLAHLAGYDQAVLTRMTQGRKDLTGPSGRERVLQIIAVLRDEGVLSTQAEANALLKASGMPPMYEGQAAEVALLRILKAPPSPPTGKPLTTTNLPAPLSSFIGREYEMAEVTRMLATTRLLTLTGSGGAGKTRLAIQVGATLAVARFAVGREPDGATGATASAERAPTFADSVWLVEFAPLSEGQFVSDMVATVFGLHAMSRTSEEVLIEYLYEKRLLLILDNCEHLIHDIAALAVKLLQACPQLHVLVTSREAFNVPGEVTWRVPSLAHDEAIDLFVERARAVRPGFGLTKMNTPCIETICTRLDAMPLALELAAARLRSLSVEQIASRLDDAFGVLTGGSRTALPRQQTLRATIDWSYMLLPEAERTLLRELSVFAGGWTLEAAEAMHGVDALDLLDQLVSKSLVVAEQPACESPAHRDGMRYRLLETIRQYARNALQIAGQDAEREARKHHLAYYRDFSSRVFASLDNNNEVNTWLDILRIDLDNLRAALAWAASCADWRSGWQILENVWEALIQPGWVSELTRWIDALILANPAASDSARLSGLLMKGSALPPKGDMVGCVRWFREAADLALQIGNESLWLESSAKLGWTIPHYEESMSILNHLIESTHRTGRRFDEIMAHLFQGERMTLAGDYAQAITTLDQAIELSRELDSPAQRDSVFGRIVSRLGQAYLFAGDYQRARSLLEQGDSIASKYSWFPQPSLLDLGSAGLLTDDNIPARKALQVYLPFALQADNMERFAQGLVLGAGLAKALCNLDAAAQLLGAATGIRKMHHTHGVFEPLLFYDYDRRLPAVRAAMAPDDFARAWDAGQALTLKEAMALALAL